jgi:hypothetical protein
MSGRRSHPRFAVASPWEGSLRVLKDVVIQRSQPEELLAISHTAGVLGEEMTLDLIGSGQTLALRVNVVESRPVIVDGSVRHRIRLRMLSSDAAEILSSHAVGVAAPPSSAEVV